MMCTFKGLAAILLITSSIIGSSYAIRCYTCAYVENFCGSESCQRSPVETSISNELTEQDIPRQPFNPACDPHGDRTNGLSGKFTSKLVLPEGMNTSVLYYPYCIKEVGIVEGRPGVLRFYDWATVPDLNGTTEEYENVDGNPVYRYYCNKDKCNSGSILSISILGLGALAATAGVSKYFI